MASNYTGNVIKTYEEVGLKEDVSDIISNLSPTETPFHSGLGSEKTTQPHYEWQEDELAAVNQTNAQQQGATYTDDALIITVMRDNYTQIMTKVAHVSGTAQASTAYGRPNERAYQIAKKMKELKRDFEWAIVGSKQSKVAPAAGTAGKFAGYHAMVDNSVTTTAPDGDPGTGGTQPSPLTEALVLEASQKLKNANAPFNTLSIKPIDAINVANFAYRVNAGSGATERGRDIGQANRIVNDITLYEGPFGKMAVVQNRWQAADTALLYDKASWKLRPLRPWFRTPLPNLADSERHAITGEYGLMHVNFSASGLITNLS